MKKLIVVLLVCVVAVFITATANAQVGRLTPSGSFGSNNVASKYKDFGVSDWFYYTGVMKKQIDSYNRHQYYNYKFRKEFTIGAIIGGVGGLGLLYTHSLPFPVYVDGDIEANKIADENLKRRRIWGYTSGVVLSGGIAIMMQAFKWNGRIRRDMYMSGTSVKYTLPSGERDYLAGKDVFKSKQYMKHYHKSYKWEKKRNRWEKKRNRWFINGR